MWDILPVSPSYNFTCSYIYTKKITEKLIEMSEGEKYKENLTNMKHQDFCHLMYTILDRQL